MHGSTIFPSDLLTSHVWTIVVQVWISIETSVLVLILFLFFDGTSGLVLRLVVWNFKTSRCGYFHKEFRVDLD
jgi:hypothetical protein